MTQNSRRRESLLRLLKRCSNGRLPLETPNFLLRRAIIAFSEGHDSLSISIGPENQGAWDVLNTPHNVDEDYRRALSVILKDIEGEFRDIHQNNRPLMQSALQNDTNRPKSAAKFFRTQLNKEDLLYESVSQFYEDVVGTPLERKKSIDLLKALPQLSGFLLAWGHSIYRRGLLNSGYGNNNAGHVDLWFATYLAHVNCFITDDKKQYQALRMIKRIYAPDCEVLRYDTFKRIWEN